jgi:superfamily II DNA or RNA helicase
MGEPVTSQPRHTTLDDVRHRIAELMLGDDVDAPESVGEISLWPHQRDAVVRLRAAIAEFGGALLADDVGTGKTFVGLAIAATYRAPLVIAPASLRGRWRDAATRSRQHISFASFESLSRGTASASSHDIVIVDEAHHARNPATKRYAALASLIAGVPALLLTATPIHNRRADLLALLALFRGAAAAALDEAALARCVVRRGREVLGVAAALPAVHGPVAIRCEPASDDTPAAIMALPPPVPAADAGIASALLAISLLRQWSSSQGALLAAIRRRLAGAHALASTLDDGHYPTRAELAWWTTGEDAQQVVMAALFAQDADAPAAGELRAAIAAHIEGLRTLRRAAAADGGLDLRRAALVREAWRSHPGARAIAFSQFAGTVDSYWRALRQLPGICALTSGGGRIASGPISRAEALGSFAPGSSGRANRACAIEALLVTDLASEGLDLHDASVLIHLDLPWTPARLEQRVGRIVRPGSPHRIVHVYAMEPPLRASSLLDIRCTLSAKLGAARAALGSVMPDIGILLDEPRGTVAIPDAAESTRRILDGWRLRPFSSRQQRTCGDDLLVSVASGESRGWLAVIGDTRLRFVAGPGSEPSDDPAIVAHVVSLVDAALPIADNHAAIENTAAIGRALSELAAWSESRRAATLAGVDDIVLVRSRRRALAAVARLSSAPASSRALDAPSARRALHVAAGPLGAARERDLRELADRPSTSDPALFDEMAGLGPASPRPQPARLAVRALVVLIPGR